MANKFKAGDHVKFDWPPRVQRDKWSTYQVSASGTNPRAVVVADGWYAYTHVLGQKGIVDLSDYNGTFYRIVESGTLNFVHWCDETWLQADTYAATLAGVLSAAKTFALPSAPPTISGGTAANPTGKFKAGDLVTIKPPPLPVNLSIATAFAKVSAPYQAKHLMECEANAGLFGDVVREDSLGMLYVSMPGAPYANVWADPSWLSHAVSTSPPPGWTAPPQKIWKFTVGETEQRFDFTPAAPKPKDRDFDGFCDRATHPDFVGWCGGHRFHKIGCPQGRTVAKQ